jgi:hypothetical protein
MIASMCLAAYHRRLVTAVRTTVPASAACVCRAQLTFAQATVCARSSDRRDTHINRNNKVAFDVPKICEHASLPNPG